MNAEEVLLGLTINGFPLNVIMDKFRVITLYDRDICDGLALRRRELDSEHCYTLCYNEINTLQVVIQNRNKYKFVFINDKQLSKEEIEQIGDRPLLYVFNNFSQKPAR